MRPDMQKTRTFPLSATALVLLGGFAANANAEDDTLAALTEPDSTVSIGIGHISGERDQFGIFDGERDSGTMLLLDADITRRDDATGTWTVLKARELGVDNRSLEVGYERQGDWGIGLDYSVIPRNAQYTVNSGITGLGSETQAVPSSGSGYVPGSGRKIILDTERERVGVNVYKHLSRGLDFKISFKNEEKNGDRHWGRGGQPEFAAEPIDSTTRTLNAVMDFSQKQLQLSGGYIGTWYDNHNDLVSTSNGANEYYLSLPLSNQAHQVFLNGGYSFTPTTRGTMRLAYTHATVDEHLPTSDISGLAWDGVGPRAFPAAPTRLDAAINTSLLFLGVTSRPNKDLSLVANLRYHKVDDKTPADLIVCRRCDDANTGNDQIVHSTPLDYKTLSGKLEGTYKLAKGYSVTAGVDVKNQDRTVPVGIDDNPVDGVDDERYVPMRSDLDETTFRVKLRKSMSDTLNGALALSHSKRDGSTYSEAVHSEGGINPLNIADRSRDKLRVSADWMPTEQVGLQFNYEYSRDDYGPGRNRYGLDKGSAQLVSVDADFEINKDWRLAGWVSRDITKASQFNGRWDRSTNDHELDVDSDLKDSGTSLGFGLRGTVNSKLKTGVDVEWTRTLGEYDDVVIPIGENGDPDTGYVSGKDPNGLPDIKTTITRVKLFADYVLAKNTTLGFDVIHERWRTNDWTWEFADGTSFIYGTSRDGTTIIADPKQSSTFVGVRYIYSFR